MPPIESLERELATLETRWKEMTAIPETPRTMIDIIEYSLGSRRRGEEYVNRLLCYFLDPTEPHGMDDEFLRAFLSELPDAVSFDEDVYDLSEVTVHQQVRIGDENVDDETGSGGIVDLVLEAEHEWFLLVELKFNATENNLRGAGPSQTEFYYDASTVGDEPKDAYESGEYYLYLHKDGTDPAREPRFVNWTWEAFIESVLQPFVAEHTPRYPQRTATQLRELLDDISQLTAMTDQQESDSEKIALYLDHYDAIADVSSTFDNHWEQFTDDWGRRLASSLEESGVGTSSELSEDVIGLTLTDDGRGGEEWRFRTSSSDWGILFKDGWWRHTSDLRLLDDRADDRDDVRIGFHHRLDKHRRAAVKGNELRFFFRCMGANDQVFIDDFNERFEAREADIMSVLPARAERTGKRDMIEATYEIRPDEPAAFFEAYVDALEAAFTDFVVENQEFVSIIDELYEESIERYR